MRIRVRQISSILLGSIALMALSTRATAQDSPNIERQSRLVQGYSKSYNVSAEEASRRLKVQRDVGAMNAKLEQEQPDTFGGLYIEHSPAFRVVVKFTSGGAATLGQYTQDPLFVAEPATVSYKQLVESQATVYKLLKGLGIDSASTVDIRTGRIKFVVENPAALDQLKNAATLKLPEFVDIGKAVSLDPQREAKIEGGRGVKSGNIANSCTTGFTVYDKSAGAATRYLTTAGHCPNTISYNNVNLPIKGENYAANTNNDFQWHTTAGFDKLTNQIYDGLSTNYTINYVYPYSSMVVGDFVCKFGAITGYTCGNVTSKNYNFIGAAGFVVVHGVNGENMSDPGDSGGPWYNDEYNEAWGSHSDSSRDNGNDGVFMPISNISASNLAVLTTP